MKSITSRSLAPAVSCSRIWFLRSTASGALESASVWFWHTRQRSSCARAATRLSSSVFCARTGAQPRTGRRKNLAIELSDERPQLLLRDLRRERADVLVADHALAVDDVGFGHAVDAVVDRDAPGGVVDREPVGVAVAPAPGQRVLARVLVIEADDRNVLREVADYRVLGEARRAPRGPHVQDPHRAEHLLLAEGLVGRVEQRQLEMRRGLADERRRHLARIQVQPDAEQRDQGDERERQPDLFHAGTVTSRRFSALNRYRRSLAARKPPSAMIRQPPQIQSTNGLCWILTSHAPSPRESDTGSPNDT